MPKSTLTVVLLSSDYLPNIGGVAAHVANLAQSLRELGHRVVVINPVPGLSETVTRKEENGIVVYKACFKSQGSHIVRKWSRIRSTIRVLRNVLDDLGAVDVIHQHDGLASALAVRVSGVRKPSNVWIWTNHTSGFLSDLKTFVKKHLIKSMFSGTDGIITVSPELLQKSKTLWGESHPITYIPNGVDLKRFSPGVVVDRTQYGLSEDDFVVLCPRRMVPKNGVIYLAHAVSQITKQYPDIQWRFVFLGSDEASNTDKRYIDEVKAVLHDAYNRGYVVYLGNVPYEMMPQVNAIADLVVVPSLMEAVSLSALEALASKKPLIATDVGGLPEVVKHERTGLLVPPGNSDAIVQAIIRMYNDTNLRERVANNGYELATRQFRWEIVANRTVEFYRQQLSRLTV